MREKHKKSSSLFCLLLLLGVFNHTSMAGDMDSRNDEIRQEIRCLNLLNGLGLEEEQARLILKSAREAERLRQEFKTILFDHEEGMRKDLGEISAYLRSSKEVPQSLAQRYHRTMNEKKKAKLNMDEQVKKLAIEVENNLEQHQIFALEKYIPCIIPPKGESRIGQAENHKAMTQGLERLRSVPSRVYQRRRGAIVQRTLNTMKTKVPRGAYLDEEAIAKYILSIYDRARRLGEPEFEIQKESLAQELHNLIKPGRDSQGVTQKVERFLLAKEIIPTLQLRLSSSGDSGSK